MVATVGGYPKMTNLLPGYRWGGVEIGLEGFGERKVDKLSLSSPRRMDAEF